MSKLFFGGMPTAMDIDKLMREIPVDHGVDIPYAVVERLLSIDWRSNRFRTVTTAWRKKLFREKLIISAADGEKFKFLSHAEAHRVTRHGLALIGKRTGRLRIKIESIDATQVDEADRDEHNRMRREVQALTEAAVKSMRAITHPPKSLEDRTGK